MKKLAFILNLFLAFNLYSSDLRDVPGLVKIKSHSGFKNPDRMIDESMTTSGTTEESSSSSVTFEITEPTTIQSLKIKGKVPYCEQYDMYIILTSLTASDKDGNTLYTLPGDKELNGSFEDITDINKDNVKYIKIEFYTGYCTGENVGRFYDIQINGTCPYQSDWVNGCLKIYTIDSKVGIGMEPSNEIDAQLQVKGKLVVDGKIESEEMEVLDILATNLNLKMDNLADYVFSEDYKLKTLEEVEDFIIVNHHLPGIPTAEEVKQKGMNVAEMNNLLLEKIEELTLYMIEMKQENEKLTKDIQSLKEKL